MRSPLLVAVTLTAFLLAATGCASSSRGDVSASQQCRRLRGKAAGRGIGLAIGGVILVGFVALAAAAGANPNFGGGGGSSRRQARRAERAAACEARALEGAPRGGEQVAREELAGEMPEIVEVPAPPSDGEALSADELQRAIAPHVEALHACIPGAEGVLQVDARIDGASGRVKGTVLEGPFTGRDSADCVATALSRVQTRPFEGVVDVRWKVRYP